MCMPLTVPTEAGVRFSARVDLRTCANMVVNVSVNLCVTAGVIVSV